MVKSFKEHLGLGTIRVGGLDAVHPIASLGDRPPKGKGSRSSRAVGLVAQKNIKGTPLQKWIDSKTKNEISDKLKLKVLDRKIKRTKDKFYKNLKPKGLFNQKD